MSKCRRTSCSSVKAAEVIASNSTATATRNLVTWVFPRWSLCLNNGFTQKTKVMGIYEKHNMWEEKTSGKQIYQKCLDFLVWYVWSVFSLSNMSSFKCLGFPGRWGVVHCFAENLSFPEKARLRGASWSVYTASTCPIVVIFWNQLEDSMSFMPLRDFHFEMKTCHGHISRWRKKRHS